MTIREVCLCASVAIGGAAVAAVSETPPSSDAVRPLRVPHAGIQPEAAVDSHGVLHLLYLRMLAGSSRTPYLLSRSARDLVNRDTRQILLTWTEGAWRARGGTLRWQRFDASGQAVGQPGGGEELPVWSFAAPVAHRDGKFTIFY